MRKITIAMLVVLSAGVWLRVDGLGAKALWADEARTWRLLQYPLGEMIGALGGMGTVHPPFYFLVMRLWTGLSGDSEWQLRSVALVGGSAAILFMFFLIQELARLAPSKAGPAGPWQGPAVLAAALVALSPFQIHMAKQARSYGLGAALLVASSWALLRAIREISAGGKGWTYGSIYALLALAFCFTHHLALVSVASQWAFALIYLVSSRLVASNHRGQGLRPPTGDGVRRVRVAIVASIVACVAAFGVAYAIWLPLALRQTSRGSRLSWRGAPELKSIPNETYIALFSTFANRLAIDSLPTRVALAALLMSLGFLAIKDGWRGRFLAIGGVVPAGLIVAYSYFTSTDLYYSRYLAFVQLIWLASIATVVSMPRRWPGRAAGTIAVLAGSAYACAASWDPIGPSAKPGIRAATEFLLDRHSRGEPIAVRNHEGLFLETLYYTRGRARPSLAAPPDLQRILSTTAHMKAGDFTTLEALATASPRGLWIISRLKDPIEDDLDPGQAPRWKRLERVEFEQDYRWEGTVVVEHYRIE